MKPPWLRVRAGFVLGWLVSSACEQALTPTPITTWAGAIQVTDGRAAPPAAARDLALPLLTRDESIRASGVTRAVR